MLQTHPHLRPCMRFLFVRPEFCPSGDLSTPKIRLSSDSASRRTPLPLTKSSRYRATSGLSPYRTCAHHVRSPGAQQKAATRQSLRLVSFGSKRPCLPRLSGTSHYSGRALFPVYMRKPKQARETNCYKGSFTKPVQNSIL